MSELFAETNSLIKAADAVKDAVAQLARDLSLLKRGSRALTEPFAETRVAAPCNLTPIVNDHSGSPLFQGYRAILGLLNSAAKLFPQLLKARTMS